LAEKTGPVKPLFVILNHDDEYTLRPYSGCIQKIKSIVTPAAAKHHVLGGGAIAFGNQFGNASGDPLPSQNDGSA
jgi:hypothetical protein